MERKITHLEYGNGIIKKVVKAKEGYWVIIYFEEVGEKKLLSLNNPLES